MLPKDPIEADEFQIHKIKAYPIAACQIGSLSLLN